MKNIAIYGAGGLGKEVKALIDNINQYSYEWNFIGYFDDNPSYKNKNINGYPVIGGMDEVNGYPDSIALVLALGNTKIKQDLASKISNKSISFPVLAHPSVIQGNKTNISFGEGTIIAAGNILTTDIKIGSHVLINLDCTIGHDVIIADFCSIMPSVNISGNVKIEEGAYLGTGAKILNNLIIGEYSTVGAGAVVIKNVMSQTTVAGVPANPIK